jgi:microcystin degradation protein MlrC
MTRPRIALLGLFLEANEFAPVSTAADFHASCYLEGQAILEEAAKPAPSMPAEIPGFMADMSAAGEWEPVPIIVTGTEPGGPAEAGFVADTLAKMRAMLTAALPLDAVYLANHGAMTATDSTDPDGAFYAMAREVVGPEIPLVATVDLHANISDRMVESTDAIISYRTNPHVDQRERAAEAAQLIRRLLAGAKLTKTFIRMPIVAPSVRLLTASGPYADLIAQGQDEKGAMGVDVVSVVGGFAWGDTPENGLAILTYAASANAGRELANRLAERSWAERERFNVSLTSVGDAVAAAKARQEDPSLPALCIADVADNPGGGGRGNTTDVLEALIEAQVEGVLLGLFVDPAVAAQCHAAGTGASLNVVFNRDNADAHGRAVDAEINVLGLSDGFIVGRRGIAAGRTSKLGPSACIRLGGIIMVVASRRIQAADPAYFESFGLDIAAFHTVVLKSRGHFRAGFDEFFVPEQIIEVDALGLTNPVLSRFPFKRLPRPVYPLDPGTEWHRQ